MEAADWKKKIGEAAWRHVAGDHDEKVVAEVLNHAAEAGFRVPERPPVVDEAGTKVIWPDGKVGLTWRGLADYYRDRGHVFFLLRIDDLLAGCGQLLLPRLQEILSAYEKRCEARGVDPLPVRDGMFVGADLDDFVSPDELGQQLAKHRRVPRKADVAKRG